MPHETENRRPAFQKSDLFWFLVLPLLMAAAYFGYRYFQQSNADPNVRLVAQFSDDVSVELKGLAFRSAIGAPTTSWWKPNGLDFPVFKPNLSSFGKKTPDAERVVVFEIDDTTETKPRFRIKPKIPPGTSAVWTTSNEGAFVFLMCPVHEGYFASNDFIVEMATRGMQTVGHLTPDKRSTEVSVAAMSLRFEIIDFDDGKEWEIILEFPHSAAPLVMLGQIDCKLLQRDGKQKSSSERGLRFNSGRNGQVCYWSFPKSDWTDVEITFVDYDRIAEFRNVSVTPGVITTPSVIEPRSIKKQNS